MNFMTFDRATCLFPALTFVRRIALSRCKGTDIDGNALDWVSALRNEGYEVPIPPGDDIAGYIPGVNSVRHVRDSFCWHIHFGGENTVQCITMATLLSDTMQIIRLIISTGDDP